MKKRLNLQLIYKPLFLIFSAIVIYLVQDYLQLSDDLSKILNTTIRTLFIYAFVWMAYIAVVPFYQLIDKEQSSLEKLILKIRIILF
jgi:hypothetical protein